MVMVPIICMSKKHAFGFSYISVFRSLSSYNVPPFLTTKLDFHAILACLVILMDIKLVIRTFLPSLFFTRERERLGQGAAHIEAWIQKKQKIVRKCAK